MPILSYPSATGRRGGAGFGFIGGDLVSPYAWDLGSGGCCRDPLSWDESDLFWDRPFPSGCYRRVWTDGVTLVGNGKDTPLSLNIPATWDAGNWDKTNATWDRGITGEDKLDKLLILLVTYLLIDKILTHEKVKRAEAGDLTPLGPSDFKAAKAKAEEIIEEMLAKPVTSTGDDGKVDKFLTTLIKLLLLDKVLTYDQLKRIRAGDLSAEIRTASIPEFKQLAKEAIPPKIQKLVKKVMPKDKEPPKPPRPPPPPPPPPQPQPPASKVPWWIATQRIEDDP